jgi:hypothetical protein
MTLIRKIALVLSVTSILLGTCLVGLILYCYYHPSKIKGLVESSISASTGALCTIDDLSYAITPLKLEAKGILLKPGENQRGFHLEIPALTAEAKLIGSFGHKSLSFKVFKISGFSMRVDREATLSTGRSEKATPSFFGGVLRRFAGFLLFKEVRVEAAEIGEGTFVFESADQTVRLTGIRATLAAGQALDMTLKVQTAWPLKKMRFESSNVHIETDAALSLVTPEVKGLLEIREAVIEGPDFSVKSVALEARGAYDHLHKRLVFNPLDCRLEGARFTPEADETDGKKILLGLQFTTEGFLDLNENRLDLSHFGLDVKDVFQLAGGLTGGFGPEQAIHLQGIRGHVVPGEALRILSDWTGEKLPAFASAADVTGILDQAKWQWQGDFTVDWSENRFAFTQKGMDVEGTVSGSIRAEGTFPDLDVAAELRVHDATFSGEGLTVRPCRAGLAVAGKYPGYRVHEFTASMPEVDLPLGENTVQIKNVEVDLGKGDVNAEKRSIHFPRGEFTSSLLKNLKLSAGLEGEQAIVSLKGENINLMPSLVALNLLPPDLTFRGDESLHLEALVHGKTSCSITGGLDLRNLGFQNPDSSYVGEGIVAAVKADAEINLTKGRTTAKTRIVVDEGEVLWDKFYADFRKNAFSGVCEGAYDGTGKTLKLSTVKLQMKDIVALDGEGRIIDTGQTPRVDLAFRIKQTPLRPVFNVFLVEPFRAETPLLSSIEVDGSVSGALKLKGSRTDWTARGNCRWVAGALSSEDSGFSIEGVDLDFPVWLRAGQGDIAQTVATGALAIQSMRVPLLPEQAIHISLDALPNQLVAGLSTHLKIPGGELEVGPVAFRDMLTTGRSIETSLTMDGVQIEPLLSGILAQPIQGVIEGTLAPIRLEGETLRSEGQIRAEVLNGEVFLSGIGVSGIFSPGPVFKMNARWDNLSLAELTSGTAFGKIEGVLQGHINGLEIAYGQPQAFDLLLETTKKKGVDQKISVKAVDNISQLGGGQSPFIGVAGAFAAIFKEFPYEKIGIRALLENDVFRINGTVKEGGKEYLVKRGGFSGVNVVNQNPDNRVRFKDMVKRIKRVTAGKGGPVVK